MNAIKSIYRCAKHQDVDSPYVSLGAMPDDRKDQKYIVKREQDQESLPEPSGGVS